MLNNVVWPGSVFLVTFIGAVVFLLRYLVQGTIRVFQKQSSYR